MLPPRMLTFTFPSQVVPTKLYFLQNSCKDILSKESYYVNIEF